MPIRPAVVACVFYKDPIAAMAWLERAFGCEITELVVDGQGRVGHAELSFRGCPIEIAGEWTGPQIAGAPMRSPASLAGANSQFLRLSVESGIDELCDRARAAGARITQEPEDQFYGARIFRAFDPEGHVWNFSQQVAHPSVAEMEQASGLRFRKSLMEAEHD
ncbi:MAG: VOC family protein [Alphaproteobacteria bacterium]|nr:VOC family protein [Alphaproteobacteria bacterium]